MLRSSGILIHITSLPGRLGCGDLGPSAQDFVDQLVRMGQRCWQVLPIGPTGYGASPYQSPSTYAGNPLLVSLERLADDGWLDATQCDPPSALDPDAVDFERISQWRAPLLHEAAARFRQRASPSLKKEFIDYSEANQAWLEDHCLFVALKEAHRLQPWTTWNPELVQRAPAAMEAARKRLMERIETERFVQFAFQRQWTALKRHSNERGVALIGDVPIFVAHDSADVWAHQGLFHLDEKGLPLVVAGVPPDYFSASGQLWGNPLYRWDVMAERGYDWWIARMRHALTLFDLVRLDHFRGFESYWEIPGDAPTAAFGRWAPGPRSELFDALRRALGRLPLIAEDLGVITPEVEALRDNLGLPGMRVLQFAFGDDAKASDYRPHNYRRDCVVYTGTHDNDTTAGWFHSEAGEGTTRSADSIERERAHVLAYTGTTGEEIHWDMIRLAWGSVASLAIAPAQDLLGLGTEARMNLPGTASGNWKWRMRPGALTAEIESRLRGLTAIYERLPPDWKGETADAGR